MADDIDIEEHDLLQNPTIQRMFPDLSVLKQEIIDFDEDLPKEEGNLKETDNNNLIGELNDLNVNKNTSKSSKDVCSFRRKIILGSKRNKDHTLKKNVKVVLQNIKPYLTRTERFCEKCLILFQSKMTLNDHKQGTHTKKYNIKQDGGLYTNHKKIKCNFCAITFANYGNLRRHERNIHFISQKSKKKIAAKTHITKTHITEANIMVKINQDTSSLKPCFHCDKIFPSQQELIDHLYNILHAENTLNEPEITEKMEINEYTDPINKNNTILQNNLINKKIVQHDLKRVYSCPICTYYFSNEKSYKNHVVVKHKAMRNMQIDVAAFNPICKFCYLKYANMLSYNTHLRKSHKFEMIKSVHNVLPDNNTEHRNRLTPKTVKKCGSISKYPNNLQLSTFITKSKNEDISNVCTNIQVMVLKIILFKCSDCHIHFLSSEAAAKHIEHSNLKTNWECTDCHILFKEKDANNHKKQHKCSTYFSIKKVFAETYSKILYKCLSCAVHFIKESFFKHYSICGSDQSQSSYCRDCDIFIESNIEVWHKDDHVLRHMTPSDFEIINSNSVNPVLNNENTKFCVEDKLKTISSTESTYMDLVQVNNKHPDVTKTKTNDWAVNYCYACKSNIGKIHKADEHLTLRCVDTIKYVCKICGLLFTQTSMSSHCKLHHKYKNLKLQDLTFYNLWTNEMMKPVIPEYPKCELCEMHFIAKVEVKKHLCAKRNYLMCGFCKKKFSRSAYILHVSFHTYNLNGRIENLNEQINKIELFHDFNETGKDEVILAIYTCKNCNLSVNMYDEVIEHCHLHTNLNKVEINGVECTICQLNLVTSSYNKHLELHKDFPNRSFRRLSFDVFNFGSDKWLNHIYKSLSRNKVNKLIEDSIYKYETRIKMAVIQEGPSHLTIYKCKKCQCIIDCNSTYSHVENCCPNSEISDCTFCDLPFVCSITRNNHEKIHAIPDITIRSYKIVIFNRKEDCSINCSISDLKKHYVVYQCRYCHVLVENYNYNYHKCHVDDCKKCHICGLIISTVNLDDHISKHKLIASFNENKIKVILLGNENEDQNVLKIDNELVPTFNGIVCDYTFYKCVNCEICVRDVRNSIQHTCLIDAAKSQCTKCDLIFDEGKLKGHLKLHVTDPDFTKETIMVKLFSNYKSSKIVRRPNIPLLNEADKNRERDYDNIKHNTSIINDKYLKGTNSSDKVSTEIIAKLYKCLCGLHYIQQSSLEEHMKKCSGKNRIKQSIQDCSKCGLSFTSDILFKHLLEHHGHKNVTFKYEIIKNPL